jgi:hypothetical protein
MKGGRVHIGGGGGGWVVWCTDEEAAVVLLVMKVLLETGLQGLLAESQLESMERQ